ARYLTSLSLHSFPTRRSSDLPHSLSYQATTLAKLPSITLVREASTMDERGSPIKSLDTSGSSATPRMPCMGPAAARRKASLISRSEEHTSELQSRENLVCRLL